MYDGKRCILIADDEPKMVRAVTDFLKGSNFHVISAQNGREAIEQYYNNSNIIDLILVDVMMPEMDGMEVLTKLREVSLTPVIMLTAKGEEYDQVVGFRNGADDYITKPFSPTLLLMRMEAILKRVGKDGSSEMQVGNIIMNPSLRSITYMGQEVEMTKREYELLLFLLSNKNIILSRQQMLDNVWGYDFVGDPRTVDTHIKQLRIKIGGKDSGIKTIHKIGYKFEWES